jgi:protein-tyrosine phosphatase
VSERSGVGDRIRTGARRVEQACRRTLVRRRLRAGGLPGAVLFVCHGNVYRSPFAANLFVNGLPAGVRSSVAVWSAGFEAPGRSCPTTAVVVAAGRGVDLGAHVSTLLTRESVREAELIVVMDPRHGRALAGRFREAGGRIVVLGDLDPLPAASRVIGDPLGRPAAELEGIYARIERCTRVLLSELTGGLRGASPRTTSQAPFIMRPS